MFGIHQPIPISHCYGEAVYSWIIRSGRLMRVSMRELGDCSQEPIKLLPAWDFYWDLPPKRPRCLPHQLLLSQWRNSKNLTRFQETIGNQVFELVTCNHQKLFNIRRGQFCENRWTEVERYLEFFREKQLSSG